MKLKILIKSVAIVTSLLGTVLFAETSLLDIQHQWANANYELKDDAQIEGFEKVIADIEQQIQLEPRNADLHIWLGISKSTLAGAKGGLGALSIAEEAKASLENALEIDATALDGSAYTSLGTLYHNVPGWPIGFGSDKEAKKLFKKALEINPNGIDPNYFYADFLYNDRKYKTAKKYLLRAQGAKPRTERPLADSGRQKEIAALLSKVEKKISR